MASPEPVSVPAPAPATGFCVTCGREVSIDGRPGDEIGSAWSHMIERSVEVVVPGHAEGCWGNCARHGCPVPVLDLDRQLEECGPVYPVRRTDGSDGA